jgi:zinc D-Ala-D-Ala carboxypeptidase
MARPSIPPPGAYAGRMAPEPQAPRLSPHFTVAELTTTSQRGRDGKLLENVPDAEALHYLRKLALVLLEPIRDLLECPIRVNSGFRCEAVERRVSGKAFGQHMLGQAADIVPLAKMPLGVAYRGIFESPLPYDQLLLERVGGAEWIHVSCAPDNRMPRRQALITTDGRNWAVYDPRYA